VDERDLERLWLRQLLDVLPTAVAVYAADGAMQLANRAYRDLAGVNVRTIDDALACMTPQREDGTPLNRDELPAIRAFRGETIMGERIRIRTADGRWAVMLVDAAPLRGIVGELVGAALVFHDITDISDLERGRRDLFSMASHDLRTPLTTILGFVQLARRKAPDDPERAQRLLSEIERQCLRMVRLVHDLLDVARFESGAIPTNPATADLGERIGAAVARQAALIDVEVPTTPVRAWFDADRIDQVLDNLLSNALRHTAPATRIVISLATESAEAVVRVTDRGPGVTREEQVRLFKPFHQTPRSRSYGGTGLGLHISRRIAEAHGGRLWLEETGPGGSTFALALPIEGPNSTENSSGP
jgi:two-component system sensor histidine kinase VicK